MEGKNMQNPFVVGDKIYLRPLDMADIDSFVLWLNDEEVRSYLSRMTPLNKIREKNFVEGLYKNDREIVLGIVVKENDQLIGNVALHDFSVPFRHAGLGSISRIALYCSCALSSCCLLA